MRTLRSIHDCTVDMKICVCFLLISFTFEYVHQQAVCGHTICSSLFSCVRHYYNMQPVGLKHWNVTLITWLHAQTNKECTLLWFATACASSLIRLHRKVCNGASTLAAGASRELKREWNEWFVRRWNAKYGIVAQEREITEYIILLLF